MKFFASFAAMVCFLTVLSCGGRPEPTSTDGGIVTPQHITGDSLLYGLACDGSNDTILVLLRNIQGNPDTFQILEATRQRQVFGHPKVGDGVALLVDSDSVVARMVVDLDQLTDSWCYKVRPTLRQRAGISEQMSQQFMRQLPDSVRDSLFAPREYGFKLKNDGSARAFGMHRSQEDEGPTVYPRLKHYGQWCLNNGLLVLMETQLDSTGSVRVTSCDTARFVLMRRDTLVLQFADETKGFYRKVED
ncbi:MAG: hypothetical protein IJ612_03785 [Prevotella sp.]|nr:hypothetical protein [Prevotella sp.]